jgi:iron-sulfur cluster repair protein YtfE (RIC family)
MDAIADRPIDGSRELLQGLTTNLRANCHRRLRQALGKLDRLTERIAKNALVAPEFMDCLQRRLLALEETLAADLAEQEDVLFPSIEALVKPTRYIENEPANGLHDALGQAALANCGVQSMMEHVQLCLCDPEWADKGPLVENLIDAVREFEEALASYVDIESAVLFPQADEIARQLTKQAR